MGKNKILLLLVLVLLGEIVHANNVLIDPITGKSIEHYNTSLKIKSDYLNPFADIEFYPTVVKNNKILSEKINAYISTMVKDDNYRNQFKAHCTRSIAYYMKIWGDNSYLSNYDKTLLSAQNVVLDEIETQPLFYYNSLLCLTITSSYDINSQFGQFKESHEFVQTIFIDTDTYTFSTLKEMCPVYLQGKFIASLSYNRNKAIHLNNLNVINRNIEDNYDYYEDELENKESLKIDSIPTKLFNEAIDLNEIIFDWNALNFSVPRNSSNTQYTFGMPYSFAIPEDSLLFYLPFIKTIKKQNTALQFKPEEINKELLKYAFHQPFFIEDEYLREYYNETPNKKKVSVFYRQKFVSDSSFKVFTNYVYNASNKVSSVETGFDNGSAARSVVALHSYDDNGNLISISSVKNNTSKIASIFRYNKDNFLISYKAMGDEDNDAQEHTYTYDAIGIHECRNSEGKNECYTYHFDALGNLVSRSAKGQKVDWSCVYSGKLKMAVGDALYSYNKDNQIDSYERDRGRYYTKYMYNSNNQIQEILMYDSKKLYRKCQVKYDQFGRIIYYTQLSYSYGQFQTQQEFKVEYGN